MLPRLRNLVVVAHAAILTLALPAAAGAATIPVNSFADENVAATDNGNCTLREAVSAAFLNGAVDACEGGGFPETDTISVPGGTYALTLSSAFPNDDNSTGDLDIDLTQGPVAIDGPDSGTPATITQTLANPERIFDSFATSTNAITLSDVVITGGNATTSGFGGALFTSVNNSIVVEDSEISGNTATGGGAISDSTGGTTTITDSIIRGNTAVNSAAQTVPGGGISAAGPVTISGSLIANNTATGSSTSTSAGVNVEGGGVDMSAGATLTIRDSTISGNSATATSPTAGPDANGGGIDSNSIISITNTTFSGNTATSADVARGGGLRFTGNPGTHSLAHSTFVGNDASGGTATQGDAVAVNGGSVGMPALRGNVFSGPQASQICGDSDGTFGPTTDSGGNVDEGTTCDLDSGTSAESVGSADLDGLAQSGAMTASNSAGPPGDREQLAAHQPNLTSPAIDRVAAAACLDSTTPTGVVLTTDARGFPRPFDTNENGTAECESGAVELYHCLGEGATIVGTPGNDGLIEGTNGADVMHGGEGNDGNLSGLDGNDRICGGAGNDTMQPRVGDDQVDGGPGAGDAAFFTDAPGPMTIDLSAGSATGFGSDTLTRTENAQGSSTFDDTLIGDAGDNTLLGSGGADTYRGGTGTGPDGSDTFSDSDFGGSSNAVDYSSRTDALTVNVTNPLGGSGGDTVGPESDTLVGIVDVIGGAGADTLTGSVNANRITGGGGTDTITANAGPDLILVRDGGPDSVDCGNDNPGDVDSVEADVQGTDTLTECLAPDLLDFVPAPANPDPGTGNPGVTTPTKPECKKGRKLKKVKGKFKCVKKKKKRR